MPLGLFDLTGKVAMVTGSTRGLGEVAATALAKAGADVAVATEDGSQGLAGRVTDLFASRFPTDSLPHDPAHRPVVLACGPLGMLRAVAVLARHSGERAPDWFRYGLTDVEPCVRLETAAALETLEAQRHRDIFDLAMNDPNPDVARRAGAARRG